MIEGLILRLTEANPTSPIANQLVKADGGNGLEFSRAGWWPQPLTISSNA